MTTTSTFTHTHIHRETKKKFRPRVSQVLLCAMKGSRKKKRVGLSMGVYGNISIANAIQHILNSLSRQISRQATEQVMMMHQGIVNLKIVSFF